MNTATCICICLSLFIVCFTSFCFYVYKNEIAREKDIRDKLNAPAQKWLEELAKISNDPSLNETIKTKEIVPDPVKKNFN